MKDYIELTEDFEHLNTRYRITYRGFAQLVEIQELVTLNFWQRRFRTDGQERVWKRIYFGHITPLKKAVQLFEHGKTIDPEKFV